MQLSDSMQEMHLMTTMETSGSRKEEQKMHSPRNHSTKLTESFVHKNYESTELSEQLSSGDTHLSCISSKQSQFTPTSHFHALPTEILTEIVQYMRLFDALQVKCLNLTLCQLIDQQLPQFLHRYFVDLMFPQEIIDLYFSRFGWRRIYRDFCLNRWHSRRIPLADRIRMRTLWKKSEQTNQCKRINLILTHCHQVHFAAERLMDGIGNLSILKGTACDTIHQTQVSSFVRFRESIQCPYTGREEEAIISVWRSFDGWLEAFKKCSFLRKSETGDAEEQQNVNDTILDSLDLHRINEPDAQRSTCTSLFASPEAFAHIRSERDIVNEMQQAFVIVFIVDLHNPLEHSQMMNCLRKQSPNSQFVTLLVGLYDCRYKLMLSHEKMLNIAKRFNALYVAVEEQQQAPSLVPTIAAKLFFESVHSNHLIVESVEKKEKSCCLQ